MIKRLAVALLVVVLAPAVYAGWYVYGAWPVPQGEGRGEGAASTG